MPDAPTSPGLLLRGGRALLPGRPTAPADVLLRDGRIAAIAPDLPAPPGADVIDARGQLLLPGLVDVHRHLWLGALSASSHGVPLATYAARVNEGFGDPFTAGDVYAGVLWGAVQALNAGVTTVADWAHNLGTAEDADANLRALRDSGIRARLYFGGKASAVGDYHDRARALAAQPVTGRVGLGLAVRGPSLSTDAETAADVALARELGLPLSLHAGMAGLPGAVTRLDQLGLLGPDVNLVHANTFTDHEWELVARSGGTVSATPTVELTMGLGTRTAVGPATAPGVPVGLGADTVAYGPTDLFTELRLVLASERAHGTTLDHRQLLDAATRGGARVLGLDGVGELAEGAVADVIGLDVTRPHTDGFGDPALAAFLGAGPADVATVVVDGRLLKRDGHLDRSLLDHARAHLHESRARITARR